MLSPAFSSFSLIYHEIFLMASYGDANERKIDEKESKYPAALTKAGGSARF
jgi:hypothetical protein